MIPKWRFLVPLSLQILMILGLPARAIYTYYTGKTVVLQTMPVDPYDLLRGYSQTLSYDISRTLELEKLSGWNTRAKNESDLTNGTRIYVILEAPQNSSFTNKPPQPWKAVAVSRDRPNNLPSDRIALEGIYRYSSIEYGLERYYLPEARVTDINREIRQLQGNSISKRPFVVEVKVNSQGNAVPASLWIGDRNYKF
jgi:uncharacterized membrane-anchored protein